MYVCIYVCTYVCMYICKYVCLYVYNVYMYVCNHNSPKFSTPNHTLYIFLVPTMFFKWVNEFTNKNFFNLHNQKNKQDY